MEEVMEYMEAKMQDMIEAGIIADQEAHLNATIQSATTQFLTTARPIIKAWLVMEDISLGRPWLDAYDAQRRAKRNGDKTAETEAFMRVQAYDEANRYLTACRKQLVDMLDGIRDNALCDHYVAVDYDGSEDAIDAGEQFNEDLARGVISVDAAVRMIGDEA